jgi:hypothetical protein
MRTRISVVTSAVRRTLTDDETPVPIRTSRPAGPVSWDGDAMDVVVEHLIRYLQQHRQQHGAFGCDGTKHESVSSDSRVSVIKVVSGNSNNALCSRHLA